MLTKKFISLKAFIRDIRERYERQLSTWERKTGASKELMGAMYQKTEEEKIPFMEPNLVSIIKG